MGARPNEPGDNPAYCVIIPTYNSGCLLRPTVEAVLRVWADVVVVVDGSTDDSRESLRQLENEHTGLRVIELRENAGKGAAVLAAMEWAAASGGFTHAVVMDSDGQHPAESIPEFIGLSRSQPEAMILGVPVFGPEAPPERVKGRRVGNFFADLETLWGGIGDSLFGFRLYPIAESLQLMRATRRGRRFDFDTEMVVGLFWAGVRPVTRPVAVFYPETKSGGVTHFRYLRDNILLVGTHVRLTLRLLPRLLRVWKLRQKWQLEPHRC
ncbi:MAG: hypothetical protein Fur0032_02070 [Terrimicrobiaceae bacterium]